MSDTELGPGGEFDAIRRMVQRWGATAEGIGDDAALLDVPLGHRLAVSTDSAVEGVHFRAEWLTPDEIAYRAVAAALSDLAAMGAMPLAILTAMSIPARWRDRLDALADGIGEAARAAGARIAGGNLTGGNELSITTTVLGSVGRPLARAGAAVGDLVYVTGALGGAGAALAAFLAGAPPAPSHRGKFAHPEPRLREGRWLVQRGATAAIDISDGLIADARHLAAASGVQIRLQLDDVPLAPGVDALDAARSGEEYEIMVTVPRSVSVAGFDAACGTPLTCIGEVVAAGTPGVSLHRGDTRVALPPGYDHFS